MTATLSLPRRIARLGLLSAMLLGAGMAWAQSANYDETLVPHFALPDVLTASDGTHITTAAEWEAKRRSEVLDMLCAGEYGYTPQGTVEVSYETLAQDSTAFDGLATAQQVMFTLRGRGHEVKALALAYIPNRRDGRVPVFIGYNFQGNHNTTTDTLVLYSPYFERLAADDPLLKRGTQTRRWPMKEIVGRGFAVVTMCYHDIFPDQPDGFAQSVLALLPPVEGTARPGAISAWAWGSSRIADWVEQQPWADATRLAIVGHSRQGKAALWAGAQDTRFRVVISNDSGCGGAALSKREYGETIAAITKNFPHWFCPAFAAYAGREQALPFDQHELLALIAPRHLYVASASEDRWADPKGEYLATYHASPVFALYGMQGLTSPDMPAIESPVTADVGYHIRRGTHDILLYDWTCYMDFCDEAFSQ